MISLKRTEIAVIGGGPAGLRAAAGAAALGARVTLIDRGLKLGGQLVKQTHKFFGSEKQYAGVRGIEIANILKEEVAKSDRIEFRLGATVLGLYDDRVLAIDQGDEFLTLGAEKFIVATGASERMIPFPNNDLPGIYGAGAVQTLMNVEGVAPGERVLMVGAGNIGLICTYQLLQAGVKVVAIVEAMPRVGGYTVHAAKVRRAKVPIYLSHTLKEARGTDCVEGATIWQLDEKGNPFCGTEKDFECDVICLAVGLSPLADLLWQAGCRMKYVPHLGGHVAIRDRYLETTVPGVYVAGDVAGVEEASSAMVEGYLAGLSAALSLGYGGSDAAQRRDEALRQLDELRAGPVGEKIRQGLNLVMKEAAGQ